LTALALTTIGVGCGKRETRVEVGDREQILHLANGDEIEDVDPQTTTGITEHNVISSLFEGLVGEDPVDLHPVPGVAERWEISEDNLTYTFHLRENAKWSNGDPVTSRDYLLSYKRILTPSLAAEYAYMLFPILNAQAYYEGNVTDFGQVGVRAPDDRTFVITLKAPTEYFLRMMANHYTTWAVHIPTVEKFGGLTKKSTAWTRPENFVGNGPFILAEWRINDVIKVKKNPLYWRRCRPSARGSGARRGRAGGGCRSARCGGWWRGAATSPPRGRRAGPTPRCRG
jgi:oligopeptide transport system substrate-binding protein